MLAVLVPHKVNGLWALLTIFIYFYQCFVSVFIFVQHTHTQQLRNYLYLLLATNRQQLTVPQTDLCIGYTYEITEKFFFE